MYSNHIVKNENISNHLHLPTEHKDTGSPTTATRDCALVKAVFNNFGLEKNPKSTSFPTASGRILTHGRKVRTVERKTALNCFPIEFNHKRMDAFLRKTR